MDSAGKRAKESIESKREPAHGPPLQARVAAANRTVLQLANCWFDPGTHGMNRGQSKMNRTGANDVEGSGHGMAKASRHTACRTKPLQADTAGKWSARHRPQKETMATVGRPRSKPTAADDVGRPLAMQCR